MLSIGIPFGEGLELHKKELMTIAPLALTVKKNKNKQIKECLIKLFLFIYLFILQCLCSSWGHRFLTVLWVRSRGRQFHSSAKQT